MTMPTADAFLFGSSAKSAHDVFNTVGGTLYGTIHDEPTVEQQREFKNNKPTDKLKYWDSGQPMLQLRVMLQTDLRDSSNPEDAGLRVLYVKGLMQQAIAQAVRAAGAPTLQVGGKLAVRYVGDGERGNAPQPPKLYAAQYQVPDVLAQVADPGANLFAQQQPAAPPVSAPAAPWGNGQQVQQPAAPPQAPWGQGQAQPAQAPAPAAPANPWGANVALPQIPAQAPAQLTPDQIKLFAPMSEAEREQMRGIGIPVPKLTEEQWAQMLAGAPS